MPSANIKYFKILFIVSLLLIALCVPGCSCSLVRSSSDTNAQEQVVKDFVQSLSDAKLEDALKLCDSTTNMIFNGSVSELSAYTTGDKSNEDVKNFIINLFPDIKDAMNQSYINYSVDVDSISLEQTDNNSAYANTRLKFTLHGGPFSYDKYTDTQFKLIKESNEWKIDFSEPVRNAVSDIVKQKINEALGISN